MDHDHEYEPSSSDEERASAICDESCEDLDSDVEVDTDGDLVGSTPAAPAATGQGRDAINSMMTTLEDDNEASKAWLA